MKITHVRVRALRSHRHGYGHDAAEFEAELTEGESPEEVAAELRKRCEAEVRHGEEVSRNFDTLQSQRDQLAANEAQIERRRSELKRLRDVAGQFQDFIQAAEKAGVRVPSILAQEAIPF